MRIDASYAQKEVMKHHKGCLCPVCYSLCLCETLPLPVKDEDLELSTFYHLHDVKEDIRQTRLHKGTKTVCYNSHKSHSIDHCSRFLHVSVTAPDRQNDQKFCELLCAVTLLTKFRHRAKEIDQFQKQR